MMPQTMFEPIEVAIESKKESLLTVGAFKEMIEFDKRVRR